MAYQPLEKLLPRSQGSVYKLVILAAKRATELADGAPRLIEHPSCGKATSVALDEIMAGKVTLKETGVVKEEKKQNKE